MSIAGAQACSFFDDDPASPTFGVVVQFNRITENSSFYTKGVGEKDFRGNIIYAGDESRLEIEAFDYDGKVTQLKDWQKNKTPLKFVLAGVHENILWYEETTIAVEEPKSFATKTRNVIKVRMEADGGEHSIWKGINLFDGAVKLLGFTNAWADDDSDGLANGVTDFGTGAVAFASDTQTKTTDTTGSQLLWIDLLMPIAGVTFTMSALYTKLHASGTDNEIRTLDSSGAQLTGLSKEATTTLSRTPSSLGTPALMWAFRCILVRQKFAGASDTHSFKFPAFRTDNSDEYIAG